MQAVRLEAERTKIRLSDELKTTVTLDLPEGKGRYRREISRAINSNPCTMELVERTLGALPPGPERRRTHPGRHR